MTIIYEHLSSSLRLSQTSRGRGVRSSVLIRIERSAKAIDVSGAFLVRCRLHPVRWRTLDAARASVHISPIRWNLFLTSNLLSEDKHGWLAPTSRRSPKITSKVELNSLVEELKEQGGGHTATENSTSYDPSHQSRGTWTTGSVDAMHIIAAVR